MFGEFGVPTFHTESRGISNCPHHYFVEYYKLCSKYLSVPWHWHSWPSISSQVHDCITWIYLFRLCHFFRMLYKTCTGTPTAAWTLCLAIIITWHCAAIWCTMLTYRSCLEIDLCCDLDIQLWPWHPAVTLTFQITTLTSSCDLDIPRSWEVVTLLVSCPFHEVSVMMTLRICLWPVDLAREVRRSDLGAHGLVHLFQSVRQFVIPGKLILL